MPDPVLYLQGMLIAAILSCSCPLVASWITPKNKIHFLFRWLPLFMGSGVFAGWRFIHLRFSWPPVNALDRLVLVVLPAILVMEFLMGSERISDRMIWFLRFLFAIAMCRILLHGSVYLGSSSDSWSPFVQTTFFLLVAAVLVAVWFAMSLLDKKRLGLSIPIAIALTIQSTGAAIMLAGYVSGGAAALPIAAGLLGVALARVAMNRGGTTKVHSERSSGIVSLGMVLLFGLVILGRLFGGLTTSVACVLSLVPMACWVSELPLVNHRSHWFVGLLRLATVAIPLLIVLYLAKATFDRETAPLLVGLSKFVSEQPN